MEKFDWTRSNGEATAEETNRAYQALISKGKISDFSIAVWCDIVNKIYERGLQDGRPWIVTIDGGYHGYVVPLYFCRWGAYKPNGIYSTLVTTWGEMRWRRDYPFWEQFAVAYNNISTNRREWEAEDWFSKNNAYAGFGKIRGRYFIKMVEDLNHWIDVTTLFPQAQSTALNTGRYIALQSDDSRILALAYNLRTNARNGMTAPASDRMQEYTYLRTAGSIGLFPDGSGLLIVQNPMKTAKRMEFARDFTLRMLLTDHVHQTQNLTICAPGVEWLSAAGSLASASSGILAAPGILAARYKENLTSQNHISLAAPKVSTVPLLQRVKTKSDIVMAFPQSHRLALQENCGAVRGSATFGSSTVRRIGTVLNTIYGFGAATMVTTPSGGLSDAYIAMAVTHTAAGQRLHAADAQTDTAIKAVWDAVLNPGKLADAGAFGSIAVTSNGVISALNAPRVTANQTIAARGNAEPDAKRTRLISAKLPLPIGGIAQLGAGVESGVAASQIVVPQAGADLSRIAPGAAASRIRVGVATISTLGSRKAKPTMAVVYTKLALSAKLGTQKCGAGAVVQPVRAVSSVEMGAQAVSSTAGALSLHTLAEANAQRGLAADATAHTILGVVSCAQLNGQSNRNTVSVLQLDITAIAALQTEQSAQGIADGCIAITAQSTLEVNRQAVVETAQVSVAASAANLSTLHSAAHRAATAVVLISTPTLDALVAVRTEVACTSNVQPRAELSRAKIVPILALKWENVTAEDMGAMLVSDNELEITYC